MQSQEPVWTERLEGRSAGLIQRAAVIPQALVPRHYPAFGDPPGVHRLDLRDLETRCIDETAAVVAFHPILRSELLEHLISLKRSRRIAEEVQCSLLQGRSTVQSEVKRADPIVSRLPVCKNAIEHGR